jgi:hypothetical protein
MLAHRGCRIPPMQAPQSSSCWDRKPPPEMRSIRTSQLPSLLLGVTSCRRDLATSALLPPRLLSRRGLANLRTQPASRLAPATMRPHRLRFHRTARLGGSGPPGARKPTPRAQKRVHSFLSNHWGVCLDSALELISPVWVRRVACLTYIYIYVYMLVNKMHV